MHYTPTASSWMNLVERFFRDLTEFITEKSFASTDERAEKGQTGHGDKVWPVRRMARSR
jgi:hypothetical protein